MIDNKIKFNFSIYCQVNIRMMGVTFPHASVLPDSLVSSPYTHSDLLDFMTRLNAGHSETLNIVRDAVRTNRLHELPNGGHATSQAAINASQPEAHLMTDLELSTYAHMASYVYLFDDTIPWQLGCDRPANEWDMETAGNCALIGLRFQRRAIRVTHNCHLGLWRQHNSSHSTTQPSTQ